MSSMSNPYAPPRAAVRDIVDPLAGMVQADRGSRLGAAFLDGIIFAVMVYAPMFVGAILAGATASSDGEPTGIGMMLGFGVGLAGLGVWAWLTIKYVKENGQSIAKKIVGIKVVRSDGSEATLGRIFWLRNFVNGILAMIPLYGLIDILFIFSESRQCVHDKLADTIVIKA
jgi:uncharacterized RDD family membrane protein YckC